MAGGASTVELAAAVSEAGGLGSLAGGYLPPPLLRQEIRRLRAATSRSVAVNLFVPTEPSVDALELDGILRVLEPYRTDLGLAPRPDIAAWSQDFGEQLDVVIEERVPVFSFTFGALAPSDMDRVGRSGAITIGTATTVAEARALEDLGVDLVCAQGSEAGGHHGSWLADAEDSLIGTFALVQLIRDAVGLPLVAAGGIMGGRAVAAALCLGAGAAQMGTAFLLCDEAGTAAPHRRAVVEASETDVVTTSAVTGRLARGVRNRLMTELREVAVPPYPVMNALTSDLRRAASASGDEQLMSLWCGQAGRLARPIPAAHVVEDVRAELIAAGEQLTWTRQDSGGTD
jgi:nitronate monooxygenase